MSSFSIELRDLLGTARLAFAACKAGHLPQPAATCSILNHSVDGMDSLINGAIDVVRGEHLHHGSDRFSLAEFVAEMGPTAPLAAFAKECRPQVLPVDRQLAIQRHRPMLFGTVVHLLRNAFNYTHVHSSRLSRAA
jgi:hypothetical protein